MKQKQSYKEFQSQYVSWMSIVSGVSWSLWIPLRRMWWPDLNETGFSKDYLAEMEKYSPLHFDYIRQKKSQSKSQRFALFQKYFEQRKPELLIKVS
jgi:hypothetical protein